MTMLMNSRLRVGLLFACLVFLSAPLGAQGLIDDSALDPVRASLRLEPPRIAPGKSVDAILTLEHDPGWHSYAADPGPSGLPTSIEWELPPGLSADSIRWPEPETF